MKHELKIEGRFLFSSSIEEEGTNAVGEVVSTTIF